MAEQVGRYQTQEVLGSGGQAVVWRAVNQDDDSEIALKVMHTGASNEPKMVNELRNEAETLKTFDHPNIVRVLEFNTDLDADKAFIAMELVPNVLSKEELPLS
ncbi:uncharacterized protein METZ01_LOCUS516601, partial [marine metagenome]